MSDDLLIYQEETPITVKPCPNCRKSHWTNTIMSLGYERLECHECGLVLFGFSGLFTEEPAVAAWNLMSTRIEELEAQLATAKEEAEDHKRALSAWFDTKELGKEKVNPAIIDAAEGYLQVSRSGGMEPDKSDLVKSVIEDMALRGVFSTIFAQALMTERKQTATPSNHQAEIAAVLKKASEFIRVRGYKMYGSMREFEANFDLNEENYELADKILALTPADATAALQAEKDAVWNEALEAACDAENLQALALHMWRVHPRDLDAAGYISKKHGGNYGNPRAAWYADQIKNMLMAYRKPTPDQEVK